MGVPLLSSLCSFFLSSSTLHEFIIRRQQESVEMQLHHLTRPLSSFHPSHTLFMLLLNLADCQFPGLLFHQVAFFHYLPDGSPTLFLHPCHSLFHFLFTSLFTLLSASPPPYASLTVTLFLCLYHLSLPYSLFPLLVHRRCNWSTTFPHIVIFKSLFASQRRESDCFIIF